MTKPEQITISYTISVYLMLSGFDRELLERYTSQARTWDAAYDVALEEATGKYPGKLFILAAPQKDNDK
jgi:hypothetical protein